jgi:hypothetical protein
VISRLSDVASDIEWFDAFETIDIKEPTTHDELPQEWKDKLGKTELPQFHYAVIPDVHLCGVAHVGIKDNDVLLENGFYGRLDLFDRNRLFFKNAMTHMNDDPVEIEWGLSLSGCWAHNYFHWILDSIPRLQALPYVERSFGVKPTILFPPNPYSFMEESWNLFKPEGYKRRLNSLHYHVQNLVVPITRRIEGLPYPSAVRYLQDLPRIEPLEGSPKKLYISRKYAETRHVENEDPDLFDPLLEMGFSLITPEKMSFTKQVSLFQNAEYIIAPHGAGLVNQIWTKQRAKVVELVTPKYSSACTWLIGEIKHHPYGMVMAEHVGYENLKVDWNKVERVMERIG